MDILKEIEHQINSIKKVDNSTYLDSIYTHIDRAEFYYKQGKMDVNFFNDVIYRSNQAYEGALKESYKVLADKTQEEVFRKSPNEIEKFLETHDIFRERVLQLFKNYRQEWRNKSTHDYKLFFDESEAFIALTSVTSFVHLLLKQIQEKTAYITQERKLTEDSENKKVIKIIAESTEKRPTEKLSEIIIEFSKENSEHIFNSPTISEVEIIGLFHAFMASIKSIKTTREPLINIGDRALMPDFLIEIDNNSMILEFKRLRGQGSIIDNAINQVLIYMQAANVQFGVIFIAMFKEANPKPKIKNKTFTIKNKVYEISIITI